MLCASCLGEFAYVQGELACVQGELFWIIPLVVLLFLYRRRGALLASPVRSRYELCSQVIMFLSCVWISEHLWSLCCLVVDFFSFSYCDYVCCQCTHQGGD